MVDDEDYVGMAYSSSIRTPLKIDLNYPTPIILILKMKRMIKWTFGGVLLVVFFVTDPSILIL
jgi:hypothetical protein